MATCARVRKVERKGACARGMTARPIGRDCAFPSRLPVDNSKTEPASAGPAVNVLTQCILNRPLRSLIEYGFLKHVGIIFFHKLTSGNHFRMSSGGTKSDSSYVRVGILRSSVIHFVVVGTYLFRIRKKLIFKFILLS